MINLIKSDFYKILRTKSFYICGALAAIFAALGVIMMEISTKMQYSMYGLEDMYVSPYTGMYSLVTGLSNATLFITIIVSMFIPSEFKFGTIKNIASRGVSRTNIYLSKLVITVFVSVAYTLLCAVAAFTAGCFIAGVGEFSRATFLDILECLALFLFAEIALQSIFQMVGFLIRGTGWTTITNIGSMLLLPTMVFNYIDLFVNACVAPWVASVSWLNSWIKINNFASGDYFPLSYLQKFTEIDVLHLDFFKHDLITGLIVCAVYIVLATTIGILNFRRRDVA